jgi:hypothetical protein
MAPIEAALLIQVDPYVETLHIGLRDYMRKLVTNVARSFAAHHWKDEKCKQLQDDDEKVPASCKVGLRLNFMHEVQESEDAKALTAQLDLHLVDVQRGLADFIKRAHALNRKGYHTRLLHA